MKTPISSEQRKALMLSLASGSLDITIFPELASRMPKTVAWFTFISGVSGDNCPPAIPFDRQTKIAALKCLKTGYFILADFLPVIDTEEKRDRFLDLMVAAST